MAWTSTKTNPWSTGSSIWGSGGLPAGSGFMSRTSTRDTSSPRDVGSMTSGARDEEIEGKSGSESLVDGSFSLESDWNRDSFAAKRNITTGRSMSQVATGENVQPQQRSFSTAISFQASSGASPYSSLASRPPATHLSATSHPQQPAFLFSNQSNPASSRGIDGPPNVYTKFKRPTLPLHQVDSATWRNGSASPSPTSERRPQFQRPSVTEPTSRNGSEPPSRHCDIMPSFQQPDYSRSGYGSTASSSRAPSVVSVPNGSYNGFSGQRVDDMAIDFSGLGLGGNSRTPTSYGPMTSSSGLDGYANTFANDSGFVRRYTNGTIGAFNFTDEIEDIDRATADYATSNGLTNGRSAFDPPHFGRGVSTFRFGQDSRDIHTIPSFTPGAIQARAFDTAPAMRPTPSSQGLHNVSMTVDRRSPSALPDTSAYMDPRLQQMLAMQLRNPYAQMYSPYTIPNAIHIPPYLSMLPSMNGVDPYAASRDLPPGDGVQSALMYEFKCIAKTKRYELKDIYDHIAEFAGDQHGSRFIQTKLESANSDEKDRVFREIEPNALQLMTDVFGNYVIQKFFEHGDQTHKKILANKLRGQVLNLSLQMYGCRVVQKALDHILVDQQAALVRELDDHVLKCVKDQNGNHVIQKAIERCPPHAIAFIFEAFRGQVASLSIHTYGCRVIQRCLERGDSPSKAMILKELMEPQGIPSMISDQYGNYVVQHVVSKDHGRAKQRVLEIVLHGLEGFSKHKFASNVVEKCLEQADDGWRRQVVCKLEHVSAVRRLEGGEDVFLGLVKDSFGNYVLRKSPLAPVR